MNKINAMYRMVEAMQVMYACTWSEAFTLLLGEEVFRTKLIDILTGLGKDWS